MTKTAKDWAYLVAYALVGWLVLGRMAAAAETQASGRVDVILWFDTEDYLLPADDDAAKRLAEMLTEKGVRATLSVSNRPPRATVTEPAPHSPLGSAMPMSRSCVTRLDAA